MSTDHTQSQSPADELRSQQLSQQSLSPPLVLDGFEAQRQVGVGAYGEVWLAIDKNTGRRVAIKFYAHRRGVDWSLLSREVEKLVALSTDRRIVQLLKVGWDAEPPYYVMEYLERGSLEDLLRERGPLPVHEAVDLFHDVLSGMQHAHAKGVFHCDLKPANILLGEDGRPRIADFGQSRLSNEQSPALGTLFYMAPEQADLSATPDMRWDVYALGAIFYRMLTGELPFRNDAALGQIESALDLPDRLARYRQSVKIAPPLVAHRKVPGVDKALVDLIERCLARSPESRAASISEIQSLLDTRAQTQAMRPMVFMGFAIPLFLTFVMALFGWRAYERAVSDTERMALQQAFENNTIAAELAAKTIALEFKKYFEVVADESRDDTFRRMFDDVAALPLAQTLSSPQTPTSELDKLRDDFIGEPKRQEFNRYLETRLARLARNYPFASCVVLNEKGVVLAAAYRDRDQKKSSVGGNYAYRSYFHGGTADRPKETRVPTVKPIEHPFLSSAFESSSSGQYRIAISTPIEESVDSETQVRGVMFLTVNLSDIGLRGEFEAASPTNQFEVLVDGREGENRGMILQHPLYNQLRNAPEGNPKNFRDKRVTIDHAGKMAAQKYFDPIGESEAGKAFRREYVAAAAPVKSLVPDSVHNGNPKTVGQSNLVVLHQQEYDSVVKPVRTLAQKLFREGLLAIACLTLTTVLIWFAVLRMNRYPRLLPGSRGRRQPAPVSLPIESTVQQRR